MKKIILNLTGILILLILIIILTGCGSLLKKEREIKKLIPKSAFGKGGTGLGEFAYPCGLAIKDNYLFVVDHVNNHIQLLQINSDGYLSYKSTFGKEGRGLGEFMAPFGLAIKDNYLYVADAGNARIQILEIQSNGNLLPKFAFGKEGKGLGEFIRSPLFITLAIKDNYLYIADAYNPRIQILEIQSNGNLLPKFAFGKEGKGLGEFGGDCGLAVKDNYLYIADAGNARIQILEIQSDGNLLPKFAFGKRGRGLGEFMAPFGLAIKDNYLYVADAGNARIQILEIQSDGNLLPKFAFGKEGKGLGEFGDNPEPSSPFVPYIGLIAKDNYLYVTDVCNSRMQVLEIKY